MRHELLCHAALRTFARTQKQTLKPNACGARLCRREGNGRAKAFREPDSDEDNWLAVDTSCLPRNTAKTLEFYVPASAAINVSVGGFFIIDSYCGSSEPPDLAYSLQPTAYSLQPTVN